MKNTALLVLSIVLFQQCAQQRTANKSEQLSQEDTKTTSTNAELDPESGLHLDESMFLVKGQCTACHSAKLITMNRFTRDGWVDKIRWMQKTQNLWDLGEAEPQILDYLEKYYSPEPQASRRKNLENIEWYELKN